MLIFIVAFFFYSATVLTLKTIIYDQQANHRDDISDIEIAFIVMYALRISFNIYILTLFIKNIGAYLQKVRMFVSKRHINKVKLMAVYVSASMVTTMIWYHFFLPYYYMILLHGREPSSDDVAFAAVWYTTGVFDEFTFSLLLIMAYVLHKFSNGGIRKDNERTSRAGSQWEQRSRSLESKPPIETLIRETEIDDQIRYNRHRLSQAPTQSTSIFRTTDEIMNEPILSNNENITNAFIKERTLRVDE